MHEASAVARFLDDSVGHQNSTGHHGDYLNATTMAHLEQTGFVVSFERRTQYCWWFTDRLQMGAFCRLLFDIRQVDDADVAGAIEDYLGVSHDNGAVGMNWELLIVACDKRCD